MKHDIKINKTKDGFDFDIPHRLRQKISQQLVDSINSRSIFYKPKRTLFFRLKIKIKRFFDLNEFIERRTTWSNFKLKVLMLLNKIQKYYK